MNVYSLKDVDAEKFGDLFTAETDAVAVRNVNSNIMKRSPAAAEFLQLFKVGSFNQVTGVLTALPEAMWLSVKWKSEKGNVLSGKFDMLNESDADKEI